jgi:predicted flap endonuclease-1-like 5' DNA nuclease
MNEIASPAPGASLLPDSTPLITSVHFIVIALFALLALSIILIGVARKRRRKQADAAFQERVEQAVPDAPPPVPVPNLVSNADAPDIALTQLKGLGPKVAARLNELGIGSVAQMAALDDETAADVDDQLGTFAGRLARDRWVEQARFLAAGDRAGFEARFGKL